MRSIRRLVFPVTALTALTAARWAYAEGAGDLLRGYEARYAADHARVMAVIPAWARRYNMNCSGCHYPAPPRLNATGQRFKWAGYRMPDDLWQPVEATNVSNYLSAGVQALYQYQKTEGATATADFEAPATSLWYAGPLGSHYSAFAELDFSSTGEIERMLQFSGMWGRTGAFGGFRAGQMHNFGEWGVAGFDRLTGLNDLTALGNPLTAAVPFAMGDHRLGAEAFYVRGQNRLSVQVLNGITADGMGVPGSSDAQKDLLVTDQLLLDNTGSGAQVVGYYGSVVGLDTVTAATLRSHYWRIGASASKITHHIEFMGGVLYGKDLDLPASLGFTGNEVSGVAYWLSGQYYLPASTLSFFGRYEYLDPNTSASGLANSRVVAGAVLPLTVPQYLRWNVELAYDAPQGGRPKTTNVATALTLTF